MSGPQAAFDQRQNEFDVAKNEFEGSIGRLSNAPRRERDAAIGEAETALDEAEKALEDMNMIRVKLPSDTSQAANQAYRDAKKVYDKMVTELAESRTPSARFDKSGGSSSADAQRLQEMENNEVLGRTNDMLARIKQTSAETTDVGIGMLSTLAGQRDQIEGTGNNLHRAERPLDNSLRTVRGMERRRKTNKLIMYAIIAVLVLLILFVLASKFR